MAFLIEDITVSKRNYELVLLFSVFAGQLNSYTVTPCKMLLVKGRRYCEGLSGDSGSRPANPPKGRQFSINASKWVCICVCIDGKTNELQHR